MAAQTNIGWTELTWNPTTGCTKISTGCKNCYAEKWANMHQKRGIKQYAAGFQLTMAPSRLNDPLKIKGNKIIFVNSMSDLFHEEVTDDFIKEVFSIMNQASRHRFQILTKRSERLIHLRQIVTIPSNVWIGVSVENNETAIRIKHLRAAGFDNSFISFEPLLENIDYIDLTGISWVIVGGESGHQARLIQQQWISTIKLLCAEAGIPFFFKQWGHGKHNPNANDPTIYKNHPFHAMGGCQLEGQIYHCNPLNF